MGNAEITVVIRADLRDHVRVGVAPDLPIADAEVGSGGVSAIRVHHATTLPAGFRARLGPILVGVIDYGMGNIRSVLNALLHLGAEAVLVTSPAGAERAQRLVLPGVGSFGAGMRRLEERGFVDAIPGLVSAGRPMLGICLGMQLLAESSSEHGAHHGLGLIPGSVERLDVAPLRVPHVGWNLTHVKRPTRLLEGLPEYPTFYYVHSYEFRPTESTAITAVADYGAEVTAVVEDGNVLGTQFHPEKSQSAGLALLANFLAL